MIAKAGADGLELKLYFLPASDTCMGMDIENLYFDVLKTVMDSVDIPNAVKLSPFFSASADIRGSLSLLEQVEPTAYERAGYVKLRQSYDRI
jgi:dihydroorotate dehydrogenase (fumarate)